MPRTLFALALLLLAPAFAPAGVGDPQLGTDDPWYPGDLSCSTFERLFATQAAVYKRVTGRDVAADEDKVLAAWLWRNTHYWHGEEAAPDLWGKGYGKGGEAKGREYWAGLFAHGYGLCGTTHAQWAAEMDVLLGRGRGRAMGVSGHNSFEAFLKGGPYGDGKWVLFDHDLSTVVYDPTGKRLLGLKEVAADWKRLTDRGFAPARQHGWLICGLHPGDNHCYADYRTAEYQPGYAGPPPVVHLRRGETLRRYLAPGLEDGKTFAFWGRNMNAAGVPGPERSITWVNQPDAMYQSKKGAGSKAGQARFANAVYTYRPDFATADYKEGVVSEDDGSVTFEFTTPYVIAATPPNDKPWGVYDAGCKNGLVVRGAGDVGVSVSVDRGATWHDGGKLAASPDVTDVVKGFRQYRLKLHAGAGALAASGLTVTTVCEASAAVMPRLKDGGTAVRFEASGRAVVSAGPAVPQAAAAVAAGKLDTPAVTLGLATPHGEPVGEVYAAGHVRSGTPPDPKVKYQVEASTDGGTTWTPVVKDWAVDRRGDEPKDFWSQSFVWGKGDLAGGLVAGPPASNVKVRFRNSGGKAFARAELHLAYTLPATDPTRVTFAWADAAGEHTATHTFAGKPGEAPWAVPTGKGVRTRWVEMTPEPR